MRQSLQSFFTTTTSTGVQSQNGATWEGAFSKTANSGFASGTPWYKGVREGRERGGWLPRIKGVGRTGKGPAAIPTSMLRALGVRVPGDEEEVLAREASDEPGSAADNATSLFSEDDNSVRKQAVEAATSSVMIDDTLWGPQPTSALSLEVVKIPKKRPFWYPPQILGDI